MLTNYENVLHTSSAKIVIPIINVPVHDKILINKEIPKVTYYYVLILNLNHKCIINFLKVISISKEYFI